MIFWFFGDKIVFFLLKYNHHCECFIIFVKFLGWIVTIWVRLAMLIEKYGDLRFWKEGSTIKITYIITKKI